MVSSSKVKRCMFGYIYDKHTDKNNVETYTINTKRIKGRKYKAQQRYIKRMIKSLSWKIKTYKEEIK